MGDSTGYFNLPIAYRDSRRRDYDRYVSWYSRVYKGDVARATLAAQADIVREHSEEQAGKQPGGDNTPDLF